MTVKLDKIICIDLEATCYKDGIFPEGEQQDITEIGVACLNLNTWEITDNKGILIRPNHSKVSDFCTELTSLTYSQLRTEGSPTYVQGIKRFVKMYGPKSRIWASWGNYDRWAIERQCNRTCDCCNCKYPLGANHWNVKSLYAAWKGIKHGIYLGTALDNEDLPREGRGHRGYVDAYWTAQILRHIMQGKVIR